MTMSTHACIGWRSRLWLVAGALAVASAKAVAAEATLEPIVVGTPSRIEVFPAKVVLDTAGRSMRLVVSGFYADGSVQDLTRAAQFSSANEANARVSEGVVSPVANGATTINVQ